MVYAGIDQEGTASVGIEDENGTRGSNPWYYGTGVNGLTLTGSTTLVFYPRPLLDCSAPTVVRCGDTIASASPAALTSNATDYYSCSPNQYFGRERVFQFDNPDYNDVTFSLSGLTPGIDLDAFLLRPGPCAEWQCLAGGGDVNTATFVYPGSHRLVIDGRKATDNGNFTLTVSCTPKHQVLTCGAPPVRGSTSGTSVWITSPCALALRLDGPEFLYEVAVPNPGKLKVTLVPDPGVELDLIAFGPNVFNPVQGCRQWGDSIIYMFNPPLGTYYFLIDGRATATKVNQGGYSIFAECTRWKLDCSAPAGDLTCAQATSGTTAGGSDRAQTYSCSTDTFDGPEAIYRFTNDTRRTVSFLFAAPPDLHLLLVPASCNEDGCLGEASGADGRLVVHDLDPGDYILVVDGKNRASGAFTLTPFCGTEISPKSGSWVLSSGQTVHETKNLSLPGDIVRGDVVFAIDRTVSMAKPLANLKTTAAAIVNQLAAQLKDLRFGLASFQDYPATLAACGYAETYSRGGDVPYRLELPLSGDRTLLQNAIQGLTVGGGGDAPEAQLRVLDEMSADAVNIGWRPASRRFAVLITDAEPHLCDADACGRTRTSTGVDPGRDGKVGTADDLDLATVSAALKGDGIVPIVLFTDAAGKPELLQDWQCWSGLAGGRAYDSPDGALAPALVADLRAGVESGPLNCATLTVQPSLGFETWIQNVTPINNVKLPARFTFDFDLGPPVGTPNGTYSFTVDVLCDGVVVASQAVTLTVNTNCTSPAGKIGNGLRAVKAAADVSLDWTAGALSPQTYNVHRLAAKASLPQPPVAPPLPALNPAMIGSEKYLDAGAVAAPGLFYYQAFGRDCAGGSLNP